MGKLKFTNALKIDLITEIIVRKGFSQSEGITIYVTTEWRNLSTFDLNSIKKRALCKQIETGRPTGPLKLGSAGNGLNKKSCVVRDQSTTPLTISFS